MAAHVDELVKSAKAAHEAHKRSAEAARKVAATVQAQTGYGRPAVADPIGAGQ